MDFPLFSRMDLLNHTSNKHKVLSTEAYLKENESFFQLIAKKNESYNLPKIDKEYKTHLLPAPLNGSSVSFLTTYLPKDVWKNLILFFLNQEDLFTLRRVCRWFRGDIVSFPFWKQVLLYENVKSYIDTCLRFGWDLNIYCIKFGTSSYLSLHLFDSIPENSFSKLLLSWNHKIPAKDLNSLLIKFPHLSIEFEKGETLLYWACVYSHQELVSALVARKKVDLDQGNGPSGLTPLLISCTKGNLDNVKLLLTHGANVSLPDFSGNTPLMLSAYYGFPQVVLEIVKCLNQKYENLKNDPYFMKEYQNEISSALKIAKPSCREVIVKNQLF